ncbi:MAG: nphR [Rhizobium sp.]|nr:nphR [Rhizobium sp.]
MQYFSTDHVPQRDRLTVLHDFVGRHVARRQFTPVSDSDVRIELAALELPGKITIGSALYSPLVGERTRELLADGRDDYLLTMHTADHELSIDGGPPIRVLAGDMMLVNEAIRSEFRLPQVAVSVISLGRSRLAGLIPRIDTKAFHHIPAIAPGLALVKGYADLLRKHPPGGQKAREAAASHLNELVALVLDGCIPGSTGRNERSVGVARLELIKQKIIERLREPDLDVGTIARSQGVSPRYLQRLFATEGLTFSEFLLANRLEMALRLLRATDPRTTTISAVAYDAGFNDLSHFNRGFRRRFGMTPSEVRADAIRNRGR